MRKIKVQPPNDKKWQRWVRDCQKETAKNETLVNKGERDSIEFKSSLYGRLREFFVGNEEPFYGKCAYCECSLGNQHGDIEHFRPKAAVTDEDDVKIDHPGYYWLAYDWTNLLPSCIKCNQASTIGERKIGKRNRFPVSDRHAQNPGEIDAEKPLLINPASGKDEDDPSRHLTIDLDTGLLIGLTPRGEMCIEIFGLNYRDDLVEQRKAALDNIKLHMYRLIDRPKEQGSRDKIAEILEGKKPFYLAQKTFFEDSINRLNKISCDRA
jgi:uncharacterized protein (TIGR02646 family)